MTLFWRGIEKIWPDHKAPEGRKVTSSQENGFVGMWTKNIPNKSAYGLRPGAVANRSETTGFSNVKSFLKGMLQMRALSLLCLCPGRLDPP